MYIHFDQNIESADAMLKAKYSKLNANIEHMCTLIHVVFNKFAATMLSAPALLISLANYYVFDMGDDSFYLQNPMMYYRRNY